MWKQVSIKKHISASQIVLLWQDLHQNEALFDDLYIVGDPPYWLQAINVHIHIYMKSTMIMKYVYTV